MIDFKHMCVPSTRASACACVPCIIRCMCACVRVCVFAPAGVRWPVCPHCCVACVFVVFTRTVPECVYVYECINPLMPEAESGKAFYGLTQGSGSQPFQIITFELGTPHHEMHLEL